MRSILLSLTILFLITCQEDDDPYIPAELIGKWKRIEHYDSEAQEWVLWDTGFSYDHWYKSNSIVTFSFGIYTKTCLTARYEVSGDQISYHYNDGWFKCYKLNANMDSLTNSEMILFTDFGNSNTKIKYRKI